MHSRELGKMGLGARAYLAVYALSYASGVMGASMPPPSIVQAEESAKDLVKVLSDVKSSIRPRHCTDILHGGQRASGVYTIFLHGDDVMGKNVYCDMDTDGGGWTVIQKRGQFGNRVYYFYRNWAEYAAGFGDPAKEYWIGNKALHMLTTDPDHMVLRIVLTNHAGENVSVEYEKMQIGSEEESFKLQLGRYLGPPGWDGLTDKSGSPFSTYDQDNDANDDFNAAELSHGAWWHTSGIRANLNSLNLNGHHDEYGSGINFDEWRSPETVRKYSYPSVYMMIRPAVLHAAGHNSTLSVK